MKQIQHFLQIQKRVADPEPRTRYTDGSPKDTTISTFVNTDGATHKKLESVVVAEVWIRYNPVIQYIAKVMGFRQGNFYDATII